MDKDALIELTNFGKTVENLVRTLYCLNSKLCLCDQNYPHCSPIGKKNTTVKFVFEILIHDSKLICHFPN